jgi:hypothetical protein
MPSVVDVLRPLWMGDKDHLNVNEQVKMNDECDGYVNNVENEPQIETTRRVGRKTKPLARSKIEPTTRRPVKDRWFYEQVIETALIAQPQDSSSGGGDEKDVGAYVKDEQFSSNVGFTNFVQIAKTSIERTN